MCLPPCLSDYPPVAAPHQLGFGTPGGVEFTSRTFHLTTPWLRWMSVKPSTASVETGFWELLKNTSLVCYHLHIHHTALHQSSCGMILKYCQPKAFSKVTPWVPCCFAWVSTSSHTLCHLNSCLLPWWWHNWQESPRPPGCLRLIRDQGKALGLFLNVDKPELISHSNSTVSTSLMSALPALQIGHPTQARLLGSPLGNEALQRCLEEQLNQLKLVGDCLSHLHMHDGITILRHSLSIPKPCLWTHPFLRPHIGRSLGTSR